MLQSSLLTALVAVGSVASAHAGLANRQNNPQTCNRDNLFRCFTATLSAASVYCASFTPTRTLTAATVTPTVSITATESRPVSSTSTASQLTSSTITTTITSTTVQFTTITATTRIVTVTPATQYTGVRLNKRTVQPAPPACLTRDGSKSTSYPASRVSSACSCLFAESTTIVTPTANPVTQTLTTTVSPVVGVVVTQTSTTILTQTSTVTTTVQSTATSKVEATETAATPRQAVNFSRAVGAGSSCTYNRYTDGFEVSNSQANDYSLGIQQCVDLCAVRSACRFAFYLRFDPNRARGADYGYCFIDDQPYDSSFLQCGYPTEKYVGYNKVA